MEHHPIFRRDLNALIPAWRKGPQHCREAAEAIALGRVQFIPGRTDDSLYLLRCWLDKPLPGDDGRFEAGDSNLLHWFPRGDDDQSLHDHPFDFVSEIVQGGYIEHLPAPHWLAHNPIPGRGLGPKWDEVAIGRFPGAVIEHRAEDLHCVGRVLQAAIVAGIGGGCWSRVRTGPKRRQWGFHPYAKRWISARDFLAGRPVTTQLQQA